MIINSYNHSRGDGGALTQQLPWDHMLKQFTGPGSAFEPPARHTSLQILGEDLWSSYRIDTMSIHRNRITHHTSIHPEHTDLPGLRIVRDFMVTWQLFHHKEFFMPRTEANVWAAALGAKQLQPAALFKAIVMMACGCGSKDVLEHCMSTVSIEQAIDCAKCAVDSQVPFDVIVTKQ